LEHREAILIEFGVVDVSVNVLVWEFGEELRSKSNGQLTEVWLRSGPISDSSEGWVEFEQFNFLEEDCFLGIGAIPGGKDSFGVLEASELGE
jgi:hypothetical protein